VNGSEGEGEGEGEGQGWGGDGCMRLRERDEKRGGPIIKRYKNHKAASQPLSSRTHLTHTSL
jgi:hypothetical protein